MVGLAGCTGGGGGGGGGNGNGSGNGGGGGPTNLDVGTSVEGTLAFRIGSAYQEYLRQTDEQEPIQVNPIVTQGSTASYRMASTGDVDLGWASTYDMANSPDQAHFSDNPVANFDQIRQTLIAQSTYAFLIAPVENDIQTWDDLEAGDTISLGSAGASFRPLMDTIVEAALGENHGVEVRYIGFGEQPGALRDGTVDAALNYQVNGDTIPGHFQEIDASIKWRPVEFTQDTKNHIQNELDYAVYWEGDPNQFDAFSGIDGTLTAAGLVFALNCLADLDPAAVKAFVRIPVENSEAFMEIDQGTRMFTEPKFFLKQLYSDVPVHQGAYEYYQEEGLWEKFGGDLTPPPEA
jgi:TRAP-type uncharacterized transport system substrate-binding protein